MRFGKTLLHLEILAGLLLALPAAAADLTDAQIRSGLTQLGALVAAEVPQNARWVLAEGQGQRFGIFTQAEDVFRTQGNTFLFDEKPGVEARILSLSDSTLYTAKPESAGGAEPSGNDRVFHGTWKNADVTQDVAAAVEWLTKEARRTGANPSAPPSSSAFSLGGMMNEDGSPNQLAQHQQTALFWAAVLQRTGHEAESLTLAKAALINADEKRRQQLIDGCFDRRANQSYEQVMQDFATHHDWAKLRDALAALLNQYPLGWQQRDAVRVFHRHVTERATLPAVPPLKTAPALSDAEQKTLLAWLHGLETGQPPEYSRWTLPLPQDEDDREVETDPFDGRQNQPQSNGASSSFPRSHGIAAVPLLTALLADETLTLVDPHQGQGMRMTRFDFGSNEDAATKLQRVYDAMPKLLTRAQLAWNLLERVVPRDLRNSSNDSLTELAPDIRSWYTSLKDATPPDIALAYLEAGEASPEVMAEVMKLTDPKKIARMQNSMLEQVEMWDLSKMEAFVEKLGPVHGLAFVAKVKQKLEGDLGRYGSSDQGNQRKQLDAGLTRLEAAAKGEKKKLGVKEMLAVLAAHSDSAQAEDRAELMEAYQAFPKLMHKLPAAERIDVILAALPDFKSPNLAVNMLNFALLGDPRVGREEIKPEARLPLLQRTRPHWQKLLDSAVPESAEEPQGLLLQIAAALEQLTTGKEPQQELSQLLMLGDRGEAILRQRATALLAGQQVEPLPSAAAIKSDAREKLLAEWSKKTPDEIARGLETLPVDQWIALNETLQRSPSLPGHFKEYVGLIQAVTLKGVADAAPWQAFRGKAWSKDTLMTLAQQISAYSGGRLMVQLQRQAPLFGFRLQVSEVPKFSGNWEVQQIVQGLENASAEFGADFSKLAKRLSAGHFQQDRATTHWAWLDAPASEAPKDPPKAANEEAAEALNDMRGEELKAWDMLAKVTAAAAGTPTQLTFISAPTAALVKKED